MKKILDFQIYSLTEVCTDRKRKACAPQIQTALDASLDILPAKFPHFIAHFLAYETRIVGIKESQEAEDATTECSAARTDMT